MTGNANIYKSHNCGVGVFLYAPAAGNLPSVSISDTASCFITGLVTYLKYYKNKWLSIRFIGKLAFAEGLAPGLVLCVLQPRRWLWLRSVDERLQDIV